MRNFKKVSREYYLRQVTAVFLAAGLLFNPVLVLASTNPGADALPHGVIDSTGIGSFDYSTPNQLDITQIQNQASIHIENFDIGANAGVEFLQPGASSFVLVKVYDGQASGIMGSLIANGGFAIQNSAGVLIGPGANINVNQLIASSLDISEEDFFNGKFDFSGAGIGEIVNYGTIEAAQGVALIGQKVRNSGVIRTGKGGFVVMTAGDRVLLGQPGSKIVVEMSSVSNPENGAVINDGLINAEEGTIVLAAGDLYSLAAELESAPAKIKTGTGSVLQSGTINAGGGDITLTAADNVTLADGSLTSSNGGANGDGGEVIVYSGGMADFQAGALIEAKGGSESGDGGFIEISGSSFLFAGDLDLSAENGSAGSLLIDPADLIIASGSGTATTNTIYEETVENLSVAGVDVRYEAENSITLEDLADNWITGGSGDITFLTTTALDSYIRFESSSDGISTTTGDITMVTGTGGIDIGNLYSGFPGQAASPGEIKLLTVGGGDIKARHLFAHGGNDALVSVVSSGDLEVSSVNADTSQTFDPAPTASTARVFLYAENDLKIHIEVRAVARATDTATASVHLDAANGTIESSGAIAFAVVTNPAGTASASVVAHSNYSVVSPNPNPPFEAVAYVGGTNVSAQSTGDLGDSSSDTDGGASASIEVAEPPSGGEPDAPQPAIITETLTFTDTDTDVDLGVETITITETVTDTSSLIGTYTATETLYTTLTGTDTLTLTDTSSLTGTYTATETLYDTQFGTDTLTITETLTGVFTETETLYGTQFGTDTLTITETLTGVFTETETLYDTQFGTDTLTITETLTGVFTETETLYDTQFGTDTLTITETLTGVFTETDTLYGTQFGTDTLTITETLTGVFTETETLYDTQFGTDTLTITGTNTIITIGTQTDTWTVYDTTTITDTSTMTQLAPLTWVVRAGDRPTGEAVEIGIVYEGEIESVLGASAGLKLEAWQSITVLNIANGGTGKNEITGGEGDLIFVTISGDGFIRFVDKNDTITTTTGSIIMIAGSGLNLLNTYNPGYGIDIGSLQAGDYNQTADPGQIFLVTVNGGHMQTGSLGAGGGLSPTVTAVSAGNMTINGDIIVSTNTANEPDPSSASVCLQSGGFIDITGLITANTHAKYQSTASIHIHADGTIDIDLHQGQVLANSSVAENVTGSTSEAYIQIHSGASDTITGTETITEEAINITGNGNNPLVQATASVAGEGGGATLLSDGDAPEDTETDGTGGKSHASIDIQNEFTTGCTTCTEIGTETEIVTMEVITEIEIATATVIEIETQTVIATATVIETETQTEIGTATVIETETQTVIGTATVIETETQTVIGTATVIETETQTEIGTATVIELETEIETEVEITVTITETDTLIDIAVEVDNAPAAPLPMFVEPLIEGCPVLLDAAALELGVTTETIQVSIARAVALSPNIQPCEACENLMNSALVLRDLDGSKMAAMIQVFNEVAPADMPPSDAMFASIAMAFSDNLDNSNMPQYASAFEYAEAFVEYIAAIEELGAPLGDSTTYAIEKYGTTLMDNPNIGGYILSRLGALGG